MIYAIDAINGDILCACPGSSNTTFTNPATGEQQCAFDCGGGCHMAWSPEDGQWNIICGL